MPKPTPFLSPGEPDQSFISSLNLVRPLVLGAVGLVALLSLVLDLLAALGRVVPGSWHFMPADAALCVLFSAIALHLSDPRLRSEMFLYIVLLASATDLLAAAVLADYGFHLSAASMPTPPQTAACFVLLALTILLLQMKQRIAARLADLCMSLLGLLVLVLVSGYIFDVLPMFGISANLRTSTLTMLCLLVLTQVALFRCAEQGVFSILMGRGIGSRIARFASPILIVLPFMREAAREHVIQTTGMPANYASAILSSLAAVFSFAFLLFLAWRIDSMEREIHNLSLRDELTGLYNLRGFHLLAEQAQLLAQRSRVPFSVLFIDLDNLKRINDEHGHSVGSATISETGSLLKATFRETDVLGRVGGDEFAVAGQFSQDSIVVATERLREASALRNSQSGSRVTLSLSIGHVTSEPSTPEPLGALLSKADLAMYEEKRRKRSTLN